MNNEKCSHPQCGFFRDAAGNGCRAMLDNACARDRAPTAGDAGTIQRYGFSQTPDEGDGPGMQFSTEADGRYVLYADHLQHVAAAVEAAREEQDAEWLKKVEWDRKTIAYLRAATAPVSAAPAAIEVIERLPRYAPVVLMDGTMPTMARRDDATWINLHSVREAFAAPSAGAPVSAADPAPVYSWGADGRPTLTNADKMPSYAAAPAAVPAAVQELPALPIKPWQERVRISFGPEDGAEVSPQTAMEYEIADWRALAVRQPQGDGSSRIKALHAAVSALYFDDSSDFRSALGSVVRHLDPAIAGDMLGSPKAAYDKVSALAAKQAGKAGAPEQKPATVRVRITSAGRTHELDIEPRPGMSELTGLLLNAMDQLKRQGMPVGHVTEIRYAKEEPCKN